MEMHRGRIIGKVPRELRHRLRLLPLQTASRRPDTFTVRYSSSVWQMRNNSVRKLHDELI
jgi:hypothetical protein